MSQYVAKQRRSEPQTRRDKQGELAADREPPEKEQPRRPAHEQSSSRADTIPIRGPREAKPLADENVQGGWDSVKMKHGDFWDIADHQPPKQSDAQAQHNMDAWKTVPIRRSSYDENADRAASPIMSKESGTAGQGWEGFKMARGDFWDINAEKLREQPQERVEFNADAWRDITIRRTLHDEEGQPSGEVSPPSHKFHMPELGMALPRHENQPGRKEAHFLAHQLRDQIDDQLNQECGSHVSSSFELQLRNIIQNFIDRHQRQRSPEEQEGPTLHYARELSRSCSPPSVSLPTSISPSLEARISQQVAAFIHDHQRSQMQQLQARDKLMPQLERQLVEQVEMCFDQGAQGARSPFEAATLHPDTGKPSSFTESRRYEPDQKSSSMGEFRRSPYDDAADRARSLAEPLQPPQRTRYAQYLHVMPSESPSPPRQFRAFDQPEPSGTRPRYSQQVERAASPPSPFEVPTGGRESGMPNWKPSEMWSAADEPRYHAQVTESESARRRRSPSPLRKEQDEALSRKLSPSPTQREQQGYQRSPSPDRVQRIEPQRSPSPDRMQRFESRRPPSPVRRSERIVSERPRSPHALAQGDVNLVQVRVLPLESQAEPAQPAPAGWGQELHDIKTELVHVSLVPSGGESTWVSKPTVAEPLLESSAQPSMERPLMEKPMSEKLVSEKPMMERPAERPTERPIGRPAERPMERLAERPIERPVERPAMERLVERPVMERPVERLAMERPVMERSFAVSSGEVPMMPAQTEFYWTTSTGEVPVMPSQAELHWAKAEPAVTIAERPRMEYAPAQPALAIDYARKPHDPRLLNLPSGHSALEHDAALGWKNRLSVDLIEYLNTGTPIIKLNRNGNLHYTRLYLLPPDNINDYFGWRVRWDSKWKLEPEMHLDKCRVSSGPTAGLFLDPHVREKNLSLLKDPETIKRCMSIQGPMRSLDFITENDQDFERWIAGLREVEHRALAGEHHC